MTDEPLEQEKPEPDPQAQLEALRRLEADPEPEGEPEADSGTASDAEPQADGAPEHAAETAPTIAPETDPAAILEVLQSEPERTGAKAAKVAAKAAADVEEEAEEAPVVDEALQLREPPDDGIKRRWYALHAHSGQEGTVRSMLLQGSEQIGLGDLVTNVLVPIEEVAEVRSGEKKTARRKSFPGYVFLQLPEHPENYPELWHLIKDTPGVTGFIGSRTVPVPVEDEEIMAIVEVARGERKRPVPKVAFNVGERVRIIDGPFANFTGLIDEINAERGTMKVMVEIFERLTSIEVEFWQVEQV